MNSACCSQDKTAKDAELKASFVVGTLSTFTGPVPQISTQLSAVDRLGGALVRWGIGRSRYRVAPGLYAIGTPDESSPVLVSANYKLSFDSLRCELKGYRLWILVIDTRGVNVWCAAGKGTFSSAKILRQLARYRMSERVSHRTLILPQLAGPGVKGYEVKQRSGFTVRYGPVRAADLPQFLEQGHCSKQMRRVSFTLAERLVVTPVELVVALKYYFIYVGLILAIHWSASLRLQSLLIWLLPPLGAIVVGTVLVPALLPFLPGRAFALKGWFMGLFFALSLGWLLGIGALAWPVFLLILPAISAFLALNFTGSSTFTSQNGVNREIRLYARPIGISFLLGCAALLGQLLFWGG